nr:EOG090X0GJG [Eurycercus lamellatus]
MKSAEELQQKLYHLLEKLQEMSRKLPLQYQQRMPYELLSGLANCLLNETIFKIVEGLKEIQNVTEKQLLQQRLQLLREHRAEKEASPDGVKDEVIQRHVAELKQADMNLIIQLDQIVTDQQTALEKAGVPGFHPTSSPQEIRVQMYLLEFILELGYVRRFWQASIDHRGVPGKAKVWGVAYKLSAETIKATKAKLDEREKRYESTLSVPFYSKNGPVHSVVCYTAALTGPLFLGEAPPSVMAEQIKTARGPSGDNLEYIAKLWEFIQDETDCQDVDDHLLCLVRVWGVAYKIGATDVEEVSQYLDYREKDGYVRTKVIFHPRQQPDKYLDAFELEFYLGTSDNPFYIGPEALQTTARHVVTSSGPSGSNREYLYALAEAVRSLSDLEEEERYLMELESAVRALDEQ